MLSLLTAWLYFTGWSYAYAYFDHFRIPLLMVDLPIEHVFVYGGLVLWKNWLLATLLLFLLAAITWGCCYSASLFGRFGLSAIAVALVLLVFTLGRLGGLSTASDDFQIQRANDFPAYPRVRLALANDAPSLDAKSMADLISSDCGRLILHNQDRLFLIRPVRDNPLDLDTFVLPWSETAALRVISTYESCR